MRLQIRRLVRLKGIKGIIRRRVRRSWPVNYDVTFQTIHGSAESFCHETWTWNHGREFNVWLYSPLKIPLFICISNLRVTLYKRKPYCSFLPIQFQMKTGELLWRHRYMSRWLLWRHTDQLFWRCFYGRFHHTGVVSQGRFSQAVHRRSIFCSVLLRFRGWIEIDHSNGLRCRGLCCQSGTALVAVQTTPAQTVSWSIPIPTWCMSRHWITSHDDYK